jgi:hypothetical protein
MFYFFENTTMGQKVIVKVAKVIKFGIIGKVFAQEMHMLNEN